MSRQLLPMEPLPISLSEGHIQLLQSGAQLQFTDGQGVLTITPPLPRPEQGYSTQLQHQVYLRLWDSQSPQGDFKTNSPVCHLDAKEIYEVYGKLQWEGISVDDGYLLLGPIENTTAPSYFVLQLLDVGSSQLSAVCYGPATSLYELQPDDLARLLSHSVFVGFASQPLSDDLVAPPELELYGNFIRLVDFDPSTHPSLKSAPWEQVVQRIGELIDPITAPDTGTSIQLMTRELCQPDTHEIVHALAVCMVLVTPATGALIHACIYRMQHIFCSYGFYDVGILIANDSVTLANDSVTLAYNAYSNLQTSLQPELSAPLGRVGRRGGSAGGYVYISNSNGRLAGPHMVTVHHVAVDGKHGAVKYESLVSQNPKEQLECPPRKLLVEMKDEVAKETSLTENQRRKRALAPGQTEDSSLEAFDETLGVLKAKSQSLIDAIKLPILGEVVASSGVTTIPTKPANHEPFDDEPWVSYMDWALVKINPERVAGSPYNFSSAFVGDARTDFAFTKRCTQTGQLSFSSLRPAIENDEEIRVTRVDRFQQVHYGTVGHRRARMRLNGQSAGLAYIVSHKNGSPFGSRGDSGSWVLDNGGHVVGMFFAISEIEKRSYFMDMVEVIEDIKTRTGLDVSLAD